MKTKKGIVALIVALLLGGGYTVTQTDLGSFGNEGYMATSTAENALYGALTTDKLLRTGFGTLGSVVVTGANTGIVNFYNATTSSVLLRTGNKATSTILIASLPASLAAGTYTFDATFTDGLLLELEAGIMPTTTVTFK